LRRRGGRLGPAGRRRATQDGGTGRFARSSTVLDQWLPPEYSNAGRAFRPPMTWMAHPNSLRQGDQIRPCRSKNAAPRGQEEQTMRVSVGQFAHETNAFSVQKADTEDFAKLFCYRGNEVAAKLGDTGSEIAGFLDVAGCEGWSVVHTVA